MGLESGTSLTGILPIAVAVSRGWRKMRFPFVSPIDGKCLLKSNAANRFRIRSGFQQRIRSWYSPVEVKGSLSCDDDGRRWRDFSSLSEVAC